MRIRKNKANLPPQILDDIFKLVEPVFFEDDFCPESNLYPLLLVCKEWFFVAERLLYASVSLGDEKPGENEDGETTDSETDVQNACHMFLETVRTNPRLASLVRKLRLATALYFRVDTERHATLISLCKNVEHIEISGYDCKVLYKLKAALAAKANLVSLTVTPCGLEQRMSRGNFCSVADLLTYLLRWPQLERIYVKSCLGGSSSEDDTLPRPSSVVGRCRVLKEIVISADSDCLRPVHLELLSKMAPRIQKFEMHVIAMPIMALRECIEAWSPTLIHLDLNHLSKVKEGHSLASLCSRLTGLRYLKADSSMIPPSAFIHFTQLESCWYCIPSRDVEELARVVQSKGILPSLREITCFQSDSAYISSDVVLQIEEAFEARNVHLIDYFEVGYD